MKNIIVILCLAILAMTAFVSCVPDGLADGENNNNGGGNESGVCTHPLSTEWASDANSHWNPTTCEHGEYRGNFGVHADADEDGACDVCTYSSGHIHTYSSEWEKDAYYHWRTATCTHTNETTELGSHADDDQNGECDVCAAHVHIVDENGRCDGCNTQIKVVDTSNLSSVIAAVLGGHANVNGGKITSTFVGRYSNSAQSTKTNKIIDYKIGKNSIYYSIASAAEVKGADKEGTYYEANTNNYMEKWVNLEADNSVFGVYRETSGGVQGKVLIDSVTADNLYGYYYNVSTLASGYGAEGILAALYERSQEKYANSFAVEENDGHYKFSFNYTAINKTNTSDGQGNALGVVTNVNYFIVSVEFSYNTEYALEYLYVTCDCYTNDAGSNLEGDLDIDNVDLEYAALTGGIVMKENAKADTYTFTVEQTAGEKTFVNEYTKAALSPSSFSVYSDRDGTILAEDTITVSLTNLPEDEYYPFVRFRVMSDDESKTFTEADEIVFTSSDDAGLYFASFDGVRKMGSFLAKKVGTYTVTVSVNGTVRTFTVNVVA